MMHYLLVKHKVANVAQWKRVFEENGQAARQGGMELVRVLRDTADPNLVFVLCKINNLKKAQAFTQAAGASDSAKKGTVIGTPEGWWLTEEKASWGGPQLCSGVEGAERKPRARNA